MWTLGLFSDVNVRHRRAREKTLVRSKPHLCYRLTQIVGVGPKVRGNRQMPVSIPVYPSRPVFIVEGQEVPGLGAALLSLRVATDTDGVAVCEATFSNWGPVDGGAGYVYFDREVIDFGRSIVARAGHGPGLVDIFSGRVTAIRGRFPDGRPPEVLVTVEDRLADLRVARRTRAFHDRTDAEVIAAIAAEHGLSVDLDIDGARHPVLVQANQTDLEFLRHRARDIDADLWAEGDTLRARARARRAEMPIVDLVIGGNLREFQVTADVSAQRTGMMVNGWDPDTKRAIREESTVAAIEPELNGLESGSRIVETAFGRRADCVVDRSPRTKAEARTLADAHFRQMARRFVQGHAIVHGDGSIRAGGRVSFHGVGALFDGEYGVRAVTHTFDTTNGFLTSLEVERPGLGGT
jgi:phage protein D